MIRTRFAPSPTGYLHVGGLRTALYSYLFAKKHNGKFILRIEDTDQERFVEGALENLIDTLHWADLVYDEGPIKEDSQIIEKGDFGPYIQSKRTEIYRKYAQELMDNGQAYRCFCTKERLDEMREKQAANKQAPMYDRKCLDLPESEIQAKIEAGEPFIIRQKIPYELIRFKDLIRGNVQFDGKTIDDQVLMKSDGFPTYHLANVVDDHLMEITHVIRGEEWLPSTPKHIALYKSFGWNPPEFAHLPLLLNADRTKLSKRQGDVAVEDYIKKGYTKEAIINFVVFLGWNPGGGEENEIFTLRELEEKFSIEKVHKSGAVFNLEKLDWFNWRWQKHKFTQELAKSAKELDPNVEIIEQKDKTIFNFTNPQAQAEFAQIRGEKLYKICNNYLPGEYKLEGTRQGREASLRASQVSEAKPILLKALITIEEKILKNPKETAEHIGFYFQMPEYSKELLTHEKMGVDLNQAKESLKVAKEALEKIERWDEKEIQNTLSREIENLGIKNGQLLWPIRAALSGLQFSPGVFEIADVLGKDETLKRIDQALNKLK